MEKDGEAVRQSLLLSDGLSISSTSSPAVLRSTILSLDFSMLCFLPARISAIAFAGFADAPCFALGPIQGNEPHRAGSIL
jgi:hypothetical protein